MQPAENLFIIIEDSEEKQILYFVEKPKFRFKSGEKNAIWNPIRIEMPTHLMPKTQEWIENGHANKLKIERQNTISEILQIWTLLDVTIDNKMIQKSRVIDSVVMSLTVSYKYASVGDTNAVL